MANRDLAAVLHGLGFEVAPGQERVSIVRGPAAQPLTLDVRTATAPSAATVDFLVRGHRRKRGGPDHIPVLVGDRISQSARERLRAAGWSWLDRRGHLRLWSPPGLFVETSVTPLADPREVYPDVLATSVGMETAIALLLDPTAEVSIRGLARGLQRAPSAVSVVLSRLREASLLTADSRPLIPELFEEVAQHWAPDRTALGALPLPGQAKSSARLELNLDDPLASGWALTDTLAASTYGAPVVVGSGFPPDFYVPSSRVARDAIGRFGLAPSYDARACTISVSPVPAAVAPRYDRSDAAAVEWFLTHPLFVALELARDRSRGREILDQWTPPEEFERVW